MSKEKFRISVIDFLPMYGKMESDQKDENGNPLCVGDAIDRNGSKMLIGYRYGLFVLLPPIFGMSYVSCPAGSMHTKLNEVVAAPGIWLIIGYTDEPFYEKVRDVKDIQVVPAN